MCARRLSNADKVSRLHKIIQSGKPLRAERAVKALGHLGSDAIPELRDALHSESVWKKLYALRAIIKIKPQPSVDLVRDLDQIAAHHPVAEIRDTAKKAKELILQQPKTRP